MPISATTPPRLRNRNALASIGCLLLAALPACRLSESPIQKIARDYYTALEARDELALRKLMKSSESASFELNRIVYPKSDFIRGIVDGTLQVDEDIQFPEFEKTSGFESTLRVRVRDRQTGAEKIRVFRLAFDMSNWKVFHVEEESQ